MTTPPLSSAQPPLERGETIPSPRQRTAPASSVTNVLWNWGVFGFTVCVAFVQSPFIVRSLGNTNYGIWVLAGSLVGYLGLLDFGVRSAVTRYIAKLHVEHADHDASRLLSTALSIFGTLGGIALIGSVLIALAVLPRFHFGEQELRTARFVVVLGGLTLSSTLIGGAFGGVIVGLQRFDTSGKIDLVMSAGVAAAIYVCLKTGLGITALAVIQLTGSGVRTLGTFLVARRLYPELRLHFVWDRSWAREIFSFSLFSTLITFSSTVILYSDSLVIGAFLPAAQITFFSIASSLTDYSRTVVRGISTTMTPKVSAIAAGARDTVAQLVLQVTRTATLLILPIGITFLIRGSAFIGLWMGPSYAEPSGLPLRILTVAMVFYAASQVAGASLLGLSRHRALVPIFIAEALVNLGLSIVLVRRFGLAGIAWGTTIPNIVTSLLLFPLITRRLLRIPLRSYYAESWIRPLIAMVPFAIGTVLVERFWPANGLVQYFAGIIGLLPLAAVGAWVVAIDPPERAAIASAAAQRVGRMDAFRRTRGEADGERPRET